MNIHVDDAVVSPNDTTSETFYLEKDREWMIAAAVIIGISSFVGAVGNSMIILSVFMVKSLRTCGNIFVVNLAFADLLITAFIDPFNVLGIVAGRRVLVANPTLCQFIASFCAPACMSSMWNMFAISFNRYILICKPHLYRRLFSVRNAITTCVCIWIFSHLVHFPTLFGWAGNKFNADYYICTVDLLTQSYAIFYMAMGIPVPLIGILISYVQIFCKVRNVKRQLMAHKHRSQKDKLISLLPDKSSKKLPRKPLFTLADIQLAKTLFAAFFLFLLCWSPFVLFVLANQPQTIPKWVYVIAIILAHSNAAVNPILYGATNERFREGYQAICCLHKNSDRRAIQFKLEGSRCIDSAVASIVPKMEDLTN